MNSVFKIIQKRYSVRKYKPDPVPEEKLKKVLEAARLAPSAHNAQAFKFVVVKDKEKRRQLARAALNQSFIAEAPIVIIAVALEPEQIMSSDVPAYAVDLAIAMSHLVLAATEEGLGTCFIGAFSQEKVKEILEIPPQFKVVVLTPLGFSAQKPSGKLRKKLEEIVCFDKFKE